MITTYHRSRAHLLLGLTLLAPGPVLAQAVPVEPAPAPAAGPPSEAELAAARDAFRQPDPRATVYALQQATARHPDSFELQHLLGRAHRRAGDSRAAADAYRRAIELDPGAAQPHVDLGDVYLRAGQRNAARREYLAALHLDRDHSGAASRLRAMLGEPEPAAAPVVASGASTAVATPHADPAPGPAVDSPSDRERPPDHEREPTARRVDRANCFVGQPRPHCASFWLTELSLLGGPSGTLGGLDLGLMVNLDERWALGGTGFLETGGPFDGRSGLRARVRRWLSDDYSVEVAAGAILGGDARGFTLDAAVNLDDVLAPMVRLEVVEDHHPYAGQSDSRRHTTLHAGIKSGGYASLVVVGAILTLGVIALASLNGAHG